jgi:hypothetical protein
MKLCLAALLTMWSAFAQSSATVRIHVINSVNKSPIPGAKVSVGSVEEPDRGEFEGRAGGDGVSEVKTTLAGSCFVRVTSRGYRAIGAGIIGKVVDVAAGQINDVTVEMLPLGVLTGRVLDQYGDPVRHAIVSTLAKDHDPRQGEYYSSLFAANTDDRGEYRIAGVEPGSYYLAIEHRASDERYYASRQLFQSPEFGGFVLYPDAPDLATAQQVKLGAGETIRLSDAHLTLRRAVKISGEIKAEKLDRAFVSVEPAGPRLSRHQSGSTGTSVAEDGHFSLEALPGMFTIKAGDASGRNAEVAIEARDKDITGLVLTLGAGYTVNGRIVVDGPDYLDFSKLIFHFMAGPIKLDAGGSFQTSVGQKNLTYMIQGLSEDWYVKSLRVAGREITGRNFQLESGDSDLVLTVSPRGARLEIAAQRAGGGPEAMMVAVLPERGIVDETSVHSSQSPPDPSGSWLVQGLPPGEYRIFLLDASNWQWLYRPDVLRDKYRELAPLVTVAEGESKRIAVPPTRIPVE